MLDYSAFACTISIYEARTARSGLHLLPLPKDLETLQAQQVLRKCLLRIDDTEVLGDQVSIFHTSARRSTPSCIVPFWVVAHTAFLNKGYITLELEQAASCPLLLLGLEATQSH